jgi:hypothetical protein
VILEFGNPRSLNWGIGVPSEEQNPSVLRVLTISLGWGVMSGGCNFILVVIKFIRRRLKLMACVGGVPTVK